MGGPRVIHLTCTELRFSYILQSPPDIQLKCSSPTTKLPTWWLHYQAKFYTTVCDKELTSVPLTAFEDIYRHYLQALLLASQNEFAELMIFWEGVNVPCAVGSPALPAPAAGGGALGRAELNPRVSKHSLSDNTSRAQPFLAVVQAPAAHFTVGSLDFASWPCASSGNCIWTRCPPLLVLDTTRSSMTPVLGWKRGTLTCLVTMHSNTNVHKVSTAILPMSLLARLNWTRHVVSMGTAGRTTLMQLNLLDKTFCARTKLPVHNRGERQEDPVCPSHHQQQKRRLKLGDKKQCCVLRQAASTSKGWIWM